MHEPLSPELVLVDPDLAARARAALPERAAYWSPAPRAVPRSAPSAPAAGPRAEGPRPYPMWARITAALWLLVIGILIGGAAIPHAQDMPRVLPPSENVICGPPSRVAPTAPPVGSPLRPGP